MAVPEYPTTVELGDEEAGDQRTLAIRPGELLLAFSEEVSGERIERILEEHRLSEMSSEDVPHMAARVRSQGMRWVRVPEGSASTEVAESVRATSPEVWLAAPVYQPDSDDTPSNMVAPIMDSIIVEVLPKVAVDRLSAEIESLGLELDELWSELVPPFLKFRIGQKVPADAFEMTDKVEQLEGVESVELDWLKLDPLEQQSGPKQWNLDEIDIDGAWGKTTGDPDVWIAVIDTGFDLDHTKLRTRFTPPATHAYFPGDGSPKLPGNVRPPTTATPPGEETAHNATWHGTAVAGVIAAALTGSAEVKGVAPGCRILPIRVFPTTDGNVAAALAWAVRQKARVINFSISGGGGTKPLRTRVQEAWASGAVICAAAGNGVPKDMAKASTKAVVYPAAYPLVIAVGACTPNAVSKALGSPDGEEWFSRFGDDLDVLAPGLVIPTTDVTGAAGYNRGGAGRSVTWYTRTYADAAFGDSQGNYIWTFTGTSAAVAHVSGLAALLFAQAPQRTNQRVRNIIERTCDQIDDPDRYSVKRPNGDWSADLGYGRINAAKALSQTVP